MQLRDGQYIKKQYAFNIFVKKIVIFVNLNIIYLSNIHEGVIASGYFETQ